MDILSIRWLKAFLKSFEGEVILITHDRDFMDMFYSHTMGIIRKSAFMVQGSTHKFYELLASNEEHYEKQKIAQEKNQRAWRVYCKNSKSCNWKTSAQSK